MKRAYRILASVALCASVSALVGCPGVGQIKINPATVQSLLQQASLALKTLDDSGLELFYGQDEIASMLVDGVVTLPKFDADGKLVLDVEAGKEKLVSVTLKDGQVVEIPVKVEKGDFKNNKASVDAFLMPGSENGKLIGEVRLAGAGEISDVFKGRSVAVKLGDARLTDENVRRLYIGTFKVPRQTFFMENGDLMLHPSNLWVLMQARGGGAMPAGGQQPGGMQQGGQQPPMGGQQPMAAPAFQISQVGQQPPPGGQQPPPGGQQPPPGGQQPPPGGQQPPPGGMQPPPGGQQQPPPGGMQPPQGGQPPMGNKAPVMMRLAVELTPGAYTVLKIEVANPPGPPPAPQKGQAQTFNLNPPSIDKAGFKVTEEVVTDLEKFEQTNLKIEQGKFLPPPPPMRQPGQQPPPGGQQPKPGGQQPMPKQPATGGQPPPVGAK